MNSRSVRHVFGLLLFFILLFASNLARATASLSVTTSFTPADASRPNTYDMDIGGVWNGSSNVSSTTGDTFGISFANSGDAPAFELDIGVTLPAGFTYVANSATVSWIGAGCPVPLSQPTVTTSQTGTHLDFDFSPAGFDLPADCTLHIDYGMTVDVGVAGGTYSFVSERAYSDTDGGPLNAVVNESQNVLLRQGDSTAEISPVRQTVVPGENGTFKVSVCNTDFGGIFNAQMDLTYTGLNFVSAVQNTTDTDATTIPMTGSNPNFLVPYLEVDKCFVVDVVATVSGCGSTSLKVDTDNTNHTAITDFTANVEINPKAPLLSFTPSSVSVPGNGSLQNFSMLVTNSGLGTASSVSFDTGYESLSVTVSNVSSGWSYNSSTGVFSYSGTLAAGASTTLSFDLSKTLSCATKNGSNSTVIWRPSYLDTCGNTMIPPTTIQSVSVAAVANPFSINKSTPLLRPVAGSTQTWTVNYDAQQTGLLTGTGEVVIEDTLPNNVDSVSNLVPSAGTLSCTPNCTNPTPGSLVTWTLNPTEALSDQTLAIDYVVPADTALACSSGDPITNSVTSTVEYLETGCHYTSHDSTTNYVNNSNGVTGSSTYFVNGTISGTFETGANADADHSNYTAAVPTGSEGEGSFLNFENTLTLGAGETGTWAGSTYVDNFGGLTSQKLVPLNNGEYAIEYQLNGGAWTQVPVANVTSSTGQLSLTLDFVDGGGAVAGDVVGLRYKTTVNDSDISSGVSRSVISISTWDIATGSSACSGDYKSPLLYSIARRASDISISMPSVVEVCGTTPVTLSVSASENSYGGLPGWNPQFDLINGSYRILGIDSYGGVYNSGNLTSVPDPVLASTDPVFTLGATPLAQSASGSITVNVALEAGSTGLPSLSSSLHYDDTQGAQAVARSFSAGPSSTSPLILKQGNLVVSVSPNPVTVYLNEGYFSVYVLNSGDGTATDVVVEDTLPTGLTPNASTSTFSPTILGQKLTFNIGSLTPGQLQEVRVGYTVAGSTCSIPNGSNSVRVAWGCFGAEHEVETSGLPNFTFPEGKANVLHDSTQANLEMCGPTSSNFVEVVVKNTGITLVKNVEAIENLSVATSGMTMIPGSVSVKTYSGTTLINTYAENATYDPDNILTGIPNYKWTSTQIPELANLYPTNASGVGPGGPITEVRIRYRLDVQDNANNSPTITSSVAAETSCGAAVASPGTNFVAPIKKPNITVSKTGRRGTSGSFGETVYAGTGDTVEWQISIANNGDYTASNLKLTENLPDTPVSPSMDISCTDGTSLTGVTDLTDVTLSNLAASSTTTCTVTQVLGASCIDQNNTASTKWGCTGASTLTTPTRNSDTAALHMTSDFLASSAVVQSWNDLPGGRAEIVLTLTNNQAPIKNLNVTDDLPGGFEFDETFTPVIGGTAALTLTTSPVAAATSPIFKFETPSELFDNGKTLTITFRVIPKEGFDTTQDSLVNPETTGNALDPNPLPSGGDNDNLVTLNYQDSCGVATSATDSVTIDPKSPDLDLSLTPTEQAILDNTDYCYDFTVVNNGEAGSSADHVTFDLTMGSGWLAHSSQPFLQIVSSQGSGATTGTCGSNSIPSAGCDIGTLTDGQSALIRACGKASTSGPLTLHGAVKGNLYDNGGADTGNDYSYDTARSKNVGITVTKTVVSTSEAWTECTNSSESIPCPTSNVNLAIGEDVTHKLKVIWFGLDPAEVAESISSINIRDSIPAGMGYVSHVAGAGNNVTINPITPGLGQTGNVDFTVGNIPFTSGGGTFEVDFTTRMLSTSANTSAVLPQTKDNVLDTSFVMLANKFCSSNLSGGCSNPDTNLKATKTVNLLKPNITVTHQVKKTSELDAAYANSKAAVGGDSLTYRVQISNASGANIAPAFDLSVLNTTLNGKLKLIGLDVDTIDNDVDATTDASDTACTSSPCEGHSTLNSVGVSDTFTFNHDNTGKDASAHPAVPGTINSLFRLDPGQTLTLLYQANIDISANPTESLLSPISFSADTLPGTSGGQVVVGDSGSFTDAYQLTDAKTATVTIDNASISKTLVSTSLSDTTGSNLAIGEQAIFRLSFVLPSGTSPGVKVRDLVPAGFRVISRDAPVLGSAITGCTSTDSPALPANGSTTLLWDFSAASCVVTAGASEVDRTVTIDYVLQVQNISTNNSNDTLVNSATFEISSVQSSAQSLTMTLKEPVLTMTKSASPTTGIDAGDEITYTVVLANTGNAPAYDIAFDDTLPTGTQYVAASRNLTVASSLITSLNEPDTGTSDHLKWGRISSPAQVLDLLPGETFTFTYKVTLLDTVEPSQVLTNSIALTYTSMPNANPTLSGVLGSAGAADGERDGSDGVGGANNNLALGRTSTATVRNVYSVSKTKTGDTLSPSGFRIGDLITYTVVASLQQGKTDNYKIVDTLPTGLVYDSTTSITAGSGVTWTGSPGTPTGTTTRTWSFGNVTVAGSNGTGTGTITLVYVVRVEDNATNNPVQGTALTRSNRARATYDLATGAAANTSNSIVASSVKQPSLTFTKSLLTPVSGNVDAGQTVKYRLLVTNTGTGPAYNVIVSDTLPTGMRTATPATAATSTLNGAAYSDAITSYNSSTGIVTWKLKETDAVNKIDAGQTWVLEFTAQVDAQVGGGQTLTNSARVTEYYSKAEPDTTARRQYAQTALSSVNVTTATPGTLSKTLVSPASGNVTIGQPVQYVIRVPQTAINAALYDVNVLDSLPTQFTAINVTSVLQSADGGVTITDNTSGHDVSVNYDYIPAGNQAVITIDAILANDVGNVETQTRSNQASYNWKSTPLGSPTTVGPTPAVNFTIVEPDLTITKTLQSSNMSDSLRGLQENDTVTYKIVVANSGSENATAYDFNVVDTSDALLTFDSMDGAGSDPGVPTGGTVSGATRVYTWASGSGDMPDHLDPGESYTFYPTFRLGNVHPSETLSNTAETNYSSRTGSDANERSYNVANVTPVTVQTAEALMSKSLVGVRTSFNVGEEIHYQLKFEPIGGRANNVRILDLLPAGFSYQSYTLSQNNVKRAGTVADPVTVLSAPSAPTAGAATMTYDLGDVEGTGAGAEIVIEVVVRVENVVGNVNAATIKNEAQAKFDNPESTGSDITLDATGEPSITVTEPSLTFDKTLVSPVGGNVVAGQTVRYRLSVTNSGTGPAYNVILRDTLPAGMRVATPATANTSTLNGAAYSDAITSYSSATGVGTWKLKDSDAVNKINAGQTWVLEYDAQVDAQVGGAQTLTNSAQITEYYSKAEADTPDRRTYSASALDSVDVTTPTPGTLSKTLVSPASGNVTIGQAVQYVIRVPAVAIDAALYDVNVLDSLPTQFTAINVTSVLQSADGGVTITDNTSGHDVSVNYDYIPAGNQAVITIDAILANDVGNVETQTRSNQASYNWKSTPLGSATTVGPTPAVNFTIVEPGLTIDKSLLGTSMSDSLRGLQMGDTVTYRITVTNSSSENATAYDFNVVDTAEIPLKFQSIVSGTNPGLPVEASVDASHRSYTWASGSGDMPTHLDPGESYTFDARFVLEAVQPYQTLSNTAETDYSSRSGVNANERSYNAENATPVDIQTGNVLISKSLVGAVTSFNVGEEIHYQLKFEPLGGRANNVRILDLLPAGFSYRSYTLSQNNVKRSGTSSDPVTVVSGPSAPTSGAATLTFNLGDIESTGAGSEIVIEVVVRVEDIVGNVNAVTIKNEANVKFDNPENPGNDITLDASGEPTITVTEPDTALAVEGPTTLKLVQPAQFTARVVNSGTGKAYQPTVRIDVPAPFNDVDPTTISSLPISVAISGGRAITLNPAEYTVGYAAGATGSLTFTFTGANAYVAPNETMTIHFPLDTNDNTVNGTAASITGTITAVNSSDKSVAVDADNRVYATTFGAGTLGTAVNAAPDDETDDHEITAETPELILTKAVNKTSYTYANETAPHKLSYTLTLSNTGSAPAVLTEIQDVLNTAYFKASTITNTSVVASDGSAGSLNVDGTGLSGSGVGVITYTGDTLDASSTVTISYDIELKDYLPNHTVVANQATATVEGYTADFVSDSTNASDDNATEEGNSALVATDDDPTNTTIVSGPVLTHEKTSTDLNGGSLDVGDVLQYTITLNNSGTEHLNTAKLKDSIPTNTTYVASSTTLNGAPVADVSGVSPLATLAGMTIEGVNGVADGSGWLKVGSSATITFQVAIATSASNGTLIINQAQLTGKGEGGDVIPTKVSDDPTTTTANDPTVDVVGTGASLQTSKTVSISQDLNSNNILDPGEELEWTITVQNTGVDTATGVVVSDAIPTAPAAYLASSLNVKVAGAGSYSAVSDDADADEAEISGANLTARMGDIPAGSSASIKFKTTIDSGATLGTILSNQASITSTNVPTHLSDCDGNPSNGTCPTTIPVGATPVIVATKTVLDLNGGIVQAGDVVRYTVTLSNTGSAAMNNLRFRDPGPSVNTGDNLEYVTSSTFVDGTPKADVSSDMPFKVAFPGVDLGNLAAGSSTTIIYDYQVPVTATDTAVFTNQGYANADNLTCSTTPTGNAECVTDSTLDDGTDLDGDSATTDDDPTVLSFNGNADKATVEGYVFLDKNHDRSREVSDTVRSGWGVELYLCSNPSNKLTTTTNGSGYWRITGVTPGSPYCVDFIHPETGLVFGRAYSTVPGVDLGSGSIKGLNLSANTVTSDQNLILDPMGVIYDSITREPVPGVTVELEYNLGAGWTLVPTNFLLPNQQGQVTGNDGVYEFNLNRVSAPTADYRIKLTNPSAYIQGVSTIIPDDDGVKVINGVTYIDALVPELGSQFDTMSPPPTTVLAAGSIVYHTMFTLTPTGPQYTDPIYNHIAIDPILDDAVIATKRSLKKNIHAGELVPYTLTFKNNLPGSAPLVGTEIIDDMPVGFSYVKGSATIDGENVEPTVSGRTLTWSPISFTGNQTKTVKVILLAGLGVKEGVYKNRTWAKHTASGRTISNIASDDVMITPDPIFDCPEIVGRVYDDKNRNGYWDDGEEGLTGIEVVTARGWRITTDTYGRYHVTCPMIPNSDIGSNFVIKLDERSLPSGYRVTTENPQVIRLTRGKMSKANFGASIDQILRVEIQDAAFKEGTTELNQEWALKLEKILSTMKDKEFRVRISYVNSAQAPEVVQDRIKALQSYLKETWKHVSTTNDLIIDEVESFYQKGGRP